LFSNTHMSVMDNEERTNPEVRYHVERTAQTTTKFEKGVEKNKVPGKTLKGFTLECLKKCKWRNLAHSVVGCFPFFNWVKAYRFREWFVGDLVSGLTVGIVHIPQSLAFSILAGLSPVFGLYTSFFPVLFYTLMGTSRHISIGTFAVTSLLTSASVERLVPSGSTQLMSSGVENSTTQASPMVGGSSLTDFDFERIGVASALTFLVGIIQLAFGIFQMGFITSFLSQPLIKALTSGAAVLVVTAQTPSILGITPMRRSGFGLVILQWIEIFRVIGTTNVATLIISIVCIIVLVIGRHLNMKYKERLPLPIPTEVFVVIIAIIASNFGRFNANFGVPIVGAIETGFPAPRVPPLGLLQDLIGDAISIAIVALAINMSLAKMYGARFGYDIDPNQELLSYGVANFVPSFFLCFPSAAALARCEIQVNSGGKTQMVGVITIVVLLLTILVVAPVFETLPRAVLGSIIIVGLIGIIAQIQMAAHFFKKSKPDFAVWLVTFASILLLGVGLGLLIGVVFSILVVVARTQRPPWDQLGNIDNSDIYKNIKHYPSANPTPGIVIFKFNSLLFFANNNYFLTCLQKATKINPDAKDKKANGSAKVSCSKSDIKMCDAECNSKDKFNSKGNTPTKYVIVDCSNFSFMDLPSVDMFKSLLKKYESQDVKLILVNVIDGVREILMRNDYYDQCGENGEFLSIHDAVLWCKEQLQKTEGENNEQAENEPRQVTNL